jgi:hypothetical protein
VEISLNIDFQRGYDVDKGEHRQLQGKS